MDFSMEKIAPFFLKVTQVFSKEFMFSKNHFENGTLLMQKIGFDSYVMVSNICSDKYLMTIIIGDELLNIDILVTSPEEMIEYMKKYMPFIEALEDFDDDACEMCDCNDCDEDCGCCYDCDEPVSYTVNINPEAIEAAFKELADEPCDWKPTFFD